MAEEQGGTVRYHRADYHSGTDEPWLVWFTKDQADPYWFTAEQGEAMGLTPPEPAPLVVTCNGHSIELSDEDAAWIIRSYSDVPGPEAWPDIRTMYALARLVRDARQDPQPARELPTNELRWSDLQAAAAHRNQPEQDDTASCIDFDALPDGTVLLRTDGRPGVRIKVDGVWTFDGHGIAAPLLRKNWKVHQPAPLSPGEHLRGLLAGRDDADRLLRGAAESWYEGVAGPRPIWWSTLRGVIGDAAREVHG